MRLDSMIGLARLMIKVYERASTILYWVLCIVFICLHANCGICSLLFRPDAAAMSEQILFSLCLFLFCLACGAGSVPDSARRVYRGAAGCASIYRRVGAAAAAAAAEGRPRGGTEGILD